MFDSHAHIGDSLFKNGLICTSSPEEEPNGYKYASVGLIPEGKSCNLEKLEYLASQGYHIGEIGLDKRYGDIENQIILFKSALEIAKSYNRFISIHMVGYPSIIFKALKDMKINNFLIHGYMGSKEMAMEFIRLGGLISISPRSIRAKSFYSLVKLPFVTETDMKMSKEEDDTLYKWNTYLSQLLDKDIFKISEERMMERLNG